MFNDITYTLKYVLNSYNILACSIIIILFHEFNLYPYVYEGIEGIYFKYLNQQTITLSSRVGLTKPFKINLFLIGNNQIRSIKNAQNPINPLNLAPMLGMLQDLFPSETSLWYLNIG